MQCGQGEGGFGVLFSECGVKAHALAGFEGAGQVFEIHAGFFSGFFEVAAALVKAALDTNHSAANGNVALGGSELCGGDVHHLLSREGHALVALNRAGFEAAARGTFFYGVLLARGQAGIKGEGAFTFL